MDESKREREWERGKREKRMSLYTLMQMAILYNTIMNTYIPMGSIVSSYNSFKVWVCPDSDRSFFFSDSLEPLSWLSFPFTCSWFWLAAGK